MLGDEVRSGDAHVNTGRVEMLAVFSHDTRPRVGSKVTHLTVLCCKMINR